MQALIAFSIKHGKFFNFVALALTTVGFFVFINARKDFIPPVQEAHIVVKVVYPGASPESVRQEIVSRIEEKTAEIPEIEKTSSVSKKNAGVVSLKVKRNHYKEVQDVLRKVQDKVGTIKFPDIAREPEFSTVDLAEDISVISVHISGGKDAHMVSRELELALRQIDGIKALTVEGREDYRYTINFNPSTLARRGISLLEAVQAVQQAIPDIPGGEILSGELNQNISLASSFDSIETIENIVLRANESLQPLLIKDLAVVNYSPKKKEAIHSLAGVEGIVFSLTKTSEKDILHFNEEVKKTVQTFQAKHLGTQFSFFGDRSIPVSTRLSLLNSNLTYGLIFVFIVLVLFMNFSTSFWTVMGIPIAFAIGAIIAVLFCGVTVNIISMVGFIVVLGIVVDDAIVFSENAYRYLEEGHSPYESVVKGMSEVLVSVCFAIFTTVGAVACMFLIGGKIGDFARPLIIIMILTLSASLVEVIFVLPGHLVQSFSKEKKLNASKWRENFFQIFYQPYRDFLSFILKWRKTALAVFLILTISTMVLLFRQIPFVFYGGPPKNILIQLETAPGTPLAETARLTAPLEDLLREDPSLENVHKTVGIAGDTHRAEIEAEIKTNTPPRHNWNPLKKLILARGASIGELTSVRFYIQREDSLSTDLIDITVKGTDDKSVKELAQTIRDHTARIPNVENPRLSTAAAGKEVRISLDPTKAHTYGLNSRYVAQFVSTAFEGTVARTLIRSGQEIDITLQYGEDFRTPKGLSNLQIPNKYNRFVSLSSIASIESVPAESEITTKDGLYAVHVLDALHNVDVQSNNSYAIQGAVQKAFSGNTHSEAYASFDNEQKDTNESLIQMLAATVLSFLVIFSLLLFMFNSYLHSTIILLTIPFIGLGISIGLFTMNLPLTNMGLTGSIALIGMVVNDGIVILEFLRFHTRKGRHFTEAVVDGASLRLRSIMMTTGTTVFGIMPVALGFAGNEFFLQPLAVAMMFGILFNSLITLVLIPLAVVILEMDMKNMFTKSLKPIHGLVVFLLLLPALGHGQDRLSNLMTENDFLTLYLQKGFSLQIYRQASLQSAEAAKGAMAPYSGSFFAQSSFMMGAETNTFPIQNLSMGGVPLSTNLSGTFTNASASLGLDATIYPSGTYLKVEGGADFINQGSTKSDLALTTVPPLVNSTDFRERYTAPYFQITLAQPFLKNGFAYDMHRRRVNLAKREARATYLQEQLRLEESIMDALKKYHSLILNVQLLAIRKESLIRMDDLLRRQRELTRVGARAPFDLLQIEIQGLKLSAGVDIMSLSLEKDFLELEKRLGISLNRTNLGFLNSSAVLGKEYDVQNIIQKALNNNSDLAKIRLLSENSRAAADMQRNQSLPELNLSLSYKYGVQAMEGRNNITTDLFYTGLQFKVPLAYDLNLAKKREAAYLARKSELEVQNYEKEIEYAADARMSEWAVLLGDIQSKEEILRLSKQVADEARNRWQNAEISLNDLFSHEENYRQAQIDLALRRYDQKCLAFGIELLQGTLLESYQIFEDLP